MSNVPQHVAVIMDGNGRWAQQHDLPRSAGHEAGYETAQRIVRAAEKHGVHTLTLFAFSCDNWLRPNEEVSFLFSLFLDAIRVESERMASENIHLNFVGDIAALSPELQAQINEAEEKTANNTGLNVVIAFNYSGKWDILQATRRLAARVEAGELAPKDITEELFESVLSTTAAPPLDLLIRTSGERRLSNFMLWQCAYTELYFSDKFWPDFNEKDFEAALVFFNQRERRFGLTGAQVSSDV